MCVKIFLKIKLKKGDYTVITPSFSSPPFFSFDHQNQCEYCSQRSNIEIKGLWELPLWLSRNKSDQYHEDVSSIPGLVQWVKDLALP